MSQSADDLFVGIGADYDNFQKGLRQVTRLSQRGGRTISRAFQSVRNSFTSVQRAITGVVGRLAALAAGFLTVRNAMQTMANMDATAKLADQIGITTEALVGLRFATEQAGGSTQSLDRTLTLLRSRLDDAASGSGRAADGLRALGLSAFELRSMGTEGAVAAISDALADVEDPARRSALTMQVFGRQAAELSTVLASGSSELREMQREADELGLTFSRIDAAKIEMANDAFNRLRKVFEGFMQDIVVNLAPAFNFLADSATGSAKSIDGVGSVGTKVANALVTAIGVVRTAWDGLQLLFRGGQVVIGNLSVAFWETARAMAKAIGFVRIAFDAFVAGAQRGLAAVMQGLRVLTDEAAVAAAYLPGMGEAASNMLIEASNGLTRASNSLRVAARERIEGAGDNTTPVLDDIIDKAREMRDGAGQAFGEVTERIHEQGNALEHTRTKFEQFRAEFEAGAIEMAHNDLDRMTETNELKEEMQEEHYDEMLRMVEQLREDERRSAMMSEAMWRSSFSNRVQMFSNFFSTISQLMNTQSRKQFEIGKAAATAGAVVDTYLAATKAYQAMAGIPVVGPALGAAAAAAAVAAGLANVRAIQSQSFGGGGGGGAPSAPAPPGAAGAAGGGGGGGGPQITEMNVALQGERFSGEQVRGLINAISEQLDDNAKLRLNVGG